MFPIPSGAVRKHGSRLLTDQLPVEKHSQAAGPGPPERGRTSPEHGPQTPADVQVVVPSRQLPAPRFARWPLQHAAEASTAAHGQPSRFLSLGHDPVPATLGGTPPPSQEAG